MNNLAIEVELRPELDRHPYSRSHLNKISHAEDPQRKTTHQNASFSYQHSFPEQKSTVTPCGFWKTDKLP